MPDRDLAERFEEHRTHLRAVAYRMLGSLADADDVVQDAWLRASRADTSDVQNLGGWLTTVVARLWLDRPPVRASRRPARGCASPAPGAPRHGARSRSTSPSRTRSSRAPTASTRSRRRCSRTR